GSHAGLARVLMLQHVGVVAAFQGLYQCSASAGVARARPAGADQQEWPSACMLHGYPPAHTRNDQGSCRADSSYADSAGGSVQTSAGSILPGVPGVATPAPAKGRDRSARPSANPTSDDGSRRPAAATAAGYR